MLMYHFKYCTSAKWERNLRVPSAYYDNGLYRSKLLQKCRQMNLHVFLLSIEQSAE